MTAYATGPMDTDYDRGYTAGRQRGYGAAADDDANGQGVDHPAAGDTDYDRGYAKGYSDGVFQFLDEARY